MSVYVDVLVVVNFIIGYLLLRIVGFLSPPYKKGWWIFSGSAVFAISALTIFLPYENTLIINLIRFICSIISILISFGIQNKKRYLIRVMLFYSVSLCFSGGIFALYLIMPNPRLYVYNGVIYPNISPMTLLIAIALSYLLTQLIIKMSGISGQNNEFNADVIICDKGNAITLKGFIDSGNKLIEPFSGNPVIVVKSDLVKRIRKKEELSLGSNGVRIIPFNSVGGGGIIYAFKPSFVEIISKEKRFFLQDVYIALAEEDSLKGDYEAIISILCLTEGAIQNDNILSKTI